ncbi:class A beta-lactamase-related serine hydrolase [Thalassotalea sp. HSM 43]|uniref:serine hydrolase domain-containing protein n=1 Tax=Thalassotalea sp. HSM 43 TaxID=2552945 RepID=UPI001080CDCD|nr:serine hydrolase domain-containing protein [Thalassotalea sp. HSM 43]QBY04375.1 class A beta-lactamase-related serine hydrolase [Thalassotalea sp. HSM 43]
MMLKTSSFQVVIVCFLALLSNAVHAQHDDIEDISAARAAKLNAAFAELVAKHNINTAGVAVIKQQKVIWQNQFGQQSSGVPATANTLFNIASLTKTITAETILRLVAQGKLSLDEPVAPYWLDPDLNGDPRVHQLTARMLLSHTGGFMNWRYFADDGKLRFIDAPGNSFNYSGEGYEYLAKYAENKLGVPFPKLVQSTIFEPLSMSSAAIVVDKNNFANIAKPLDKDGKFYGFYCHPAGYCSKEGSYSAAANLVITVADYARFLISSMQGEGLSAALKQDRNTMQGIQFKQSEIICGDAPASACPSQLGYGLGWSMAHLPNGNTIGHRGTNWSIVSLTYYYPDSGDGLIVFFNAPNKAGIAGMIDALELLDPDSPEIQGYKLRLARAQ